MIRTFIVHDVTLVRELVAYVLDAEADMCVVGRAASPAEALSMFEKSMCDVIVVHGMLPEKGSLALVRTLQKQQTQVRVVVTGVVDSQVAILHCLEAGAAGYVLEDDSLTELVRAVRHAYQGAAVVSPAVAGALIHRISELRRLATELNGYHEADLLVLAAELTDREHEILGFLAQGHSNRTIATALFITVGTVKNHVHNILDKLDVHTRKQAAMVARQLAIGDTQPKLDRVFTWAEELGIPIKTRRDAAAML